MIKYRLNCNDCNISFDSWFASSKEFERLKKKKLLNCHNCNSPKVEKTIMSPRLINKSNEKQDLKFKKTSKKIQEYQNFIKKNFDYVGNNFAHEARSIHYNEKKKNKGIYGSASNIEIKELKEEGIDAEIMPWFKENNN
tara:strand:+ start:125 stop:541 length:417 start_codon:yes stop_codon:yes gene_type:complete